MSNYTPFPEPLLEYAWQHGLFPQEELRTRDGLPVLIVNPGHRNTEKGPPFLDAEIQIGEKTYVGNVAVHARASDWDVRKRNCDPPYDSVILNIVADNDRIVHKVDGGALPSAKIEVSEHLQRIYRALCAGSEKSACGYHLARNFSEIEFKAACTRLMVDRLERKYNDILKIYDSVDKSWHETFHVLLFRSMGLGKNKDIYMSLARNAPYAKLCQERGEVRNIEAMLFGVAGLLDPAVYDDYKTNLTERFELLRHRHQLRVMTYCEWSDKGVRPYNFVPKRIAQLATLINDNDFTLNRILECESLEAVRGLFAVELPEYWQRSFSFDSRGERLQTTIGEFALDILAINLVVPILFAYGRLEGKEELEERAIDFLYETRAEKNRYTEGWRLHGVRVEHALTSQALIQLSTEYCARQRCTECFIGNRVLKNSL